MKRMVTFATPLVLLTLACGQADNTSTGSQERVLAEKPFSSGGAVTMELDGGNYDIRSTGGDQIRVTARGNIGNASADITVVGSRATVVVKDSPHNNFGATIDVPMKGDRTVRLSGGNLAIDAEDGNLDIDSIAGNVALTVGPAGRYKAVDATVKAGNLGAGPFGQPKSGLFQQLSWSGSGQYTIRANLGAGNLAIESK